MYNTFKEKGRVDFINGLFRILKTNVSSPDFLSNPLFQTMDLDTWINYKFYQNLVSTQKIISLEYTNIIYNKWKLYVLSLLFNFINLIPKENFKDEFIKIVTSFLKGCDLISEHTEFNFINNYVDIYTSKINVDEFIAFFNNMYEKNDILILLKTYVKDILKIKQYHWVKFLI